MINNETDRGKETRANQTKIQRERERTEETMIKNETDRGKEALEQTRQRYREREREQKNNDK